MKTLLHLIHVSRPVSWPNTAYPFAAGYLVSYQVVDWRLVIGTIFFLVPYNLVMYGVNDVYDYESDIKNPRKGGMEGALSARQLHRTILVAAAAGSLPFIITLLALGTLRANFVLLIVMFFVLAYSLPKLRFKERPFLDSITSSIHFVGPLVYALSFGGVRPAAWLAIAAFFLWGMASHAFGAVQDIVADRGGGIGSIATVLGAGATVRFAILLYTVSSLLLVAYGWPAAIMAAVGGLYIANIWRYRSVSDDHAEQANVAWRRFIFLNLFAGFIVTLLLMLQYLVQPS